MKNQIIRISFAFSLMAAPIAISIPTHAADTAPLYTITAQTYHLNLSGKVLVLGKASAGAHVALSVQPRSGKVMEASTVTNDDGSYTLQVAFEAFPSESMDWKLTAQQGLAGGTEMDGRQILSDETALGFQKHISLSDELAMAARPF